MKPDGSTYWSLSITNPFHLASIMSFCSTIVVPPVCYAAIFKYFRKKILSNSEFGNFRFRKVQDNKINGLSSSAKIARKRRNLVSMQFNMMNWLLEIISLIPVMFVENVFLNILYLLVNSCGTPLVILFNLCTLLY